MLSFVVYASPFLLALLVVVALVGIYTNFRRASRAPYFRLRRQATRRGWRWIFILLLSVGGFIWTMTARRSVPAPVLNIRSLVPIPSGSTATLGLELPPTVTLDPSLATKDIYAGAPTITPTQPTATATPTPLIRTLESPLTAPPDATLTITAISTDISPALQPISPGDTFVAGVSRIYFFFAFTNMVDGASWSQVLLLNDSLIRSESELWEQGAEGNAYYWFGAQGGWPSGRYEIRFYVGDRLLAAQSYTLVD